MDDLALFLSAVQVAALIAATPWPYNVLVRLAAWSGLRAAEIAGLRVGDVMVPKPSANPNAPAKPGTVRVEQTIAWTGAAPTAMAPKTKGSRRTVPLTAATTAVLRDYLIAQPRRDDPSAPLFPGVRLMAPRPTGVRADAADTGAANTGVEDAAPSATANERARRQADALAKLSVTEAEARLDLNWTQPLRHATFYKAVFRPAVLRANRTAGETALPPGLKFHALRHFVPA